MLDVKAVPFRTCEGKRLASSASLCIRRGRARSSTHSTLAQWRGFRIFSEAYLFFFGASRIFAQKALRSLDHKVLARELPGWQDQLPPEQKYIAHATATKLMQPEEELQYKELMKRCGEAWTIQGQLHRLAKDRKGGLP
jgi:hypothetical protein